MFSNKVYNVLKYVTQIVLPAIGTFYFALASIWGFPHGEEVVGTLTVIITFLGTTLGISTHRYNKNGIGSDGAIVIDQGDDVSGNAYVQFDKELSDIRGKNEIVLKVVKNGS